MSIQIRLLGSQPEELEAARKIIEQTFTGHNSVGLSGGEGTWFWYFQNCEPSPDLLPRTRQEVVRRLNEMRQQLNNDPDNNLLRGQAAALLWMLGFETGIALTRLG